jgi:hypothetical protein
MSLAKTAQYNDLVDLELMLDEPEEHLNQSVLEPHEEELLFSLPLIPGAEDQSDIEIDEAPVAELSSDEGVIEIKPSDPHDWRSRGLSNFLPWVKEMFANVPKHSGHDIVGLEKVIAYLSHILKQISVAVRSDYKNEIDNNKAEKARAEIEDAVGRCEERLDKILKNKSKKKKGEAYVGMVKEAQKAPGISGIVVNVPLFISSLARLCINGALTGGHDIEDIFEQLNKKYKLTDREKVELIQILNDMNYPMSLRDRGWDLDETGKLSDETNLEFSAQYPS